MTSPADLRGCRIFFPGRPEIFSECQSVLMNVYYRRKGNSTHEKELRK